MRKNTMKKGRWESPASLFVKQQKHTDYDFT